MNTRYSRQIKFEGVGETGQQRLLDSTVGIIGLGALGTVSANNLARAGVGNLRLIDRDYVELSNLQRQSLYDEDDVKNEKPKAVAANEHLAKVNSNINIASVIADVNPSNIERLISDCDLILDCTDNFEIRLLLNEACDHAKIPWIYCGALGSACMTLNIIPGKTPCFLCLSGEAGASGSEQTCATVGVLNMVTNIAASVQSAEAIKILMNSEDVRKSLFFMDVWSNTTEYLDIKINPECPVCGRHHYTRLGQAPASFAASLCGRNEIQVVPGKEADIDFDRLADNLSSLGNVNYNKFMLKFDDGRVSIKLFKDGRAIIQNAKDENHARAIYTEYFGM
jgi:adenylyltransferase/sulfurtransferase